MLARTLGPKFNQFPCYLQPKLNGVRALYQIGVFQSRGEKLWKPTFFPHIVDQIHSLSLGPVILDGEFYVHGWRLQRINSAVGVNNNEPNDDTKNIEFHIFDVIEPNKYFSHRWFEIYNTLADPKLQNVRRVHTDLACNRGEVELYFNQYTSRGYEGVMLRPDGPYEFGEHIGRGGTTTSFRSTCLWKHKSWQDGEFMCVGVTLGQGKASIGIGALTLKGRMVPDENGGWNPFGVGTGFTDEERIEYMKNPPIGKLVKIRYLQLTADGIPFNPSFLCVMP